MQNSISVAFGRYEEMQRFVNFALTYRENKFLHKILKCSLFLCYSFPFSFKYIKMHQALMTEPLFLSQLHVKKNTKLGISSSFLAFSSFYGYIGSMF